MINEYHRAKTINEAVQLLARSTITSYPLGGGTVLSQFKGVDEIAVVDLQDLGLDKISFRSEMVSIGASVTLQQLLEAVSQPAYRRAIELESSFNNRQRATMAGALVSADGRSPLATLMLALDIKLIWMPGGNEFSYKEWLLTRKIRGNIGFISAINYSAPAQIVYDQVSRSPQDKPILCISVCRWNPSTLRISVGGFGESPVLFYDGSPSAYTFETCQSVLDGSDDDWASSEYRKHVAKILINRMYSR